MRCHRSHGTWSGGSHGGCNIGRRRTTNIYHRRGHHALLLKSPLVTFDHNIQKKTLTGVCGCIMLWGVENPGTYECFVGCCIIVMPIPSPNVGVKLPMGANGGTCCVWCCCCCKAFGRICWSSSGWCKGVPKINHTIPT